MIKNISETQKIAITTLLSGIIIGFTITLLVFFIQRSISYNNEGSNIETSTIESEDLISKENMITSFTGEVMEVISNKELIVKLNEKNIRVLINPNTKIIKQSMKTIEEQRADLENYRKLRSENPEAPISPKLPFSEIEVGIDSIQLNTKIRIMSEDELLGAEQVKASEIIVGIN